MPPPPRQAGRRKPLQDSQLANPPAVPVPPAALVPPPTVSVPPVVPVPPFLPAPPAPPSLAGGNASIIHYAISAAYDAALAHARSLELDRRERDLEQRLRASEEQAAKHRFMTPFSSQFPPFP